MADDARSVGTKLDLELTDPSFLSFDSTGYYGHVLPATADQNSKQCLTLSTGNPQAKTSLFAGSVCNFNDNQSQEWNTFGLVSLYVHILLTSSLPTDPFQNSVSSRLSV